MIGFAAGTVWLATSPVWLIRSGEQIEVNDNQWLSDDNVKALLPLSYPQSLLKIKPDDLAESLVAYAPIKSVEVSRRLVPPRLQVELVERQPVAIALPDTTQPVEKIPTQPMPFAEPGLIDAEGYWMPRDSFRAIGANDYVPKLTVKGMRASDQAAWRTLFRSVSRSPVVITMIDWTSPSNLILHSELGLVQLGPYGRNFEAQLAALDQLRSLESKIDPKKVALINLQDPDNPVIEILQAAKPPAESP